MNTPICDFVSQYVKTSPLRLHMPGHKGVGPLGAEALDITEVEGADSLYEASGIIKESEQNAGSLFGCNTCYSTEGSSLCIRAMLYLALLNAEERKLSRKVLAGRNAHKTFLTAAALLDLQVEWLYSDTESSYLSCNIDPKQLETILASYEEKPAAVYITSPDYLGNIADVSALAEVCHRYGTLLLCDNAHGAYLKFLPDSLHPMDAGADMCCDSAHKTLPVLTGGAYLHISCKAPDILHANAKDALGMFGSTSPSYLILQSLDMANPYLQEKFRGELSLFAEKTEKLKKKLTDNGYILYGNEPLKITLSTKSYGYKGTELAKLLQCRNIICEFSDPDFIVFMLSPLLRVEALEELETALLSIPKLPPVAEMPPALKRGERVMSPREASLSLRETVSSSESEGRILASISIACPPAVPIAVCGERITAEAVRSFSYYGVETCTVVKQ